MLMRLALPRTPCNRPPLKFRPSGPIDGFMDIANATLVNTAVNQAQADTADAVNLRVLRKALDLQAAGAATLLDALPQQPALATEGALGRRLNVYA